MHGSENNPKKSLEFNLSQGINQQHPPTYPAVIKLDSELGVWTSRGGSVRADHGGSHGRLPVLPEGVLAEDKVGEVERQTRGLPDPHLQPRDQTA